MRARHAGRPSLSSFEFNHLETIPVRRRSSILNRASGRLWVVGLFRKSRICVLFRPGPGGGRKLYCWGSIIKRFLSSHTLQPAAVLRSRPVGACFLDTMSMGQNRW